MSFSDLTYVQKTQKKAPGAIIQVDKNKSKSENLPENSLYLKCLLFDIKSEKSVLFGNNSLKKLIVFDMNFEKVFIVYFGSSGLYVL